MTSLHLTGLTKSFEDVFKLGPLDLSLSEGETLALLGQNGAGKSTLFQMITGNMDADSGSISLKGVRIAPDAPEVKRRIGYLPQHAVLPPWVTANEMLHYAAVLHELPDRDQVVKNALAYWDAAYYANKPLAACSHGMQKRVGLALATMHDPELAVLDEPFSGLDLFHIRALDQCLRKRKAMGQTSIISTHIAPYCAKLCDRVLIMRKGQASYLEPWSTLDELQRTASIEAAFFGPEV